MHYNIKLRMRRHHRSITATDDGDYCPINLDNIYDEDDPLLPWLETREKLIEEDSEELEIDDPEIRKAQQESRADVLDPVRGAAFMARTETAQVQQKSTSSDSVTVSDDDDDPPAPGAGTSGVAQRPIQPSTDRDADEHRRGGTRGRTYECTESRYSQQEGTSSGAPGPGGPEYQQAHGLGYYDGYSYGQLDYNYDGYNEPVPSHSCWSSPPDQYPYDYRYPDPNPSYSSQQTHSQSQDSQQLEYGHQYGYSTGTGGYPCSGSESLPSQDQSSSGFVDLVFPSGTGYYGYAAPTPIGQPQPDGDDDDDVEVEQPQKSRFSFWW